MQEAATWALAALAGSVAVLAASLIGFGLRIYQVFKELQRPSPPEDRAEILLALRTLAKARVGTAVTAEVGSSSGDFEVPAEDDAVLRELRRHGVRPGQRWHLTLVSDRDLDDQTEGQNLLPGYVGSFRSGQTTLSARVDEVLETGFGR
jgi:hypothetical protein